MVRLISTVGACVASACLAGCTGQTVEGAWHGRFPLEGVQSCEVRLQSNMSYTIACDGTAVVGAGRYTWDRRSLVLSSTVMTYGGHPSRGKPEFEFEVDGHGNTMTLHRQGESFQWSRGRQ